MISTLVRHPTLANLLMIGIAVVGVMSLGGLQRETLPDVSKTKVQVSVVWPGATAAEVEARICRQIEDALDGTVGLAELRSAAREGLGQVTAEMDDAADRGAFLIDVQTAVDGLSDLPDEADSPTLVQLGRTSPVVSLAVAGPMEPLHLWRFCEQLERDLRRRGISLIELAGFSDRQLRVRLREEAALRYGLTASAVADRIAAMSVDAPAGTVRAREQEVIVRITEARRSPQALGELVIVSGASGAEIRLDQIATIREAFEDEDEAVLLRGPDGELQRAGVLKISKSKQQDALKVLREVQAFVAEQRQRVPAGVQLTLTDDRASIVAERLQLLVTNGWQGLLLVAAVLWLFFNVRFALWVAAGLPVSFLGALALFGPAGLTVNMITLVGLLVALGLLMDDSLVIAESVAERMQSGLDGPSAAVAGISRIGAGVFSSFLTTVVVFGPLTQLDGNIGRVLLALPIALILVLSVSLIEAFLILPAHLSHSPLREPSAWRAAFERAFGWLTGAIAGLARLAIGNRYLTLALAVALLLSTMAALQAGVVAFQGFPDLEGDTVQARLLLPEGTPRERSEAIAREMVAALERVVARHAADHSAPLIRGLRLHVGSNPDVGGAGPHLATITADLLGGDARKLGNDALLAAWQAEIGVIPDAISVRYCQPTQGPGGSAIAFQLSGEDLGALDRASQRIAGALDRYRGAYNLRDDLRAGKPELRLQLRPGAAASGLDARALGAQLAAALRGREVDEVQLRGETYEVAVQLDGDQLDSLPALRALRVELPGGGHSPLGELVELRWTRGWSQINRVDGQRTVTIEGDVDTRLGNAAQIRNAFISEELPGLLEGFPGVRVAIDGEAEDIGKTQSSMGNAAVIGLLGIFAILSFQFRSWIEPLVVMALIPLAFPGVVFGHWLLGHPLTMPSMMGFVSLAGVVVNDSILLVSFLKEARADQPDLVLAGAEAVRGRFRAIFLTSTTTVFGLLPLMSETSLQAQMLIPLAISIVFGLLASTVLVLFVIPCLYAALDDIGLLGDRRGE